MRYYLDTNILMYMLNREPDELSRDVVNQKIRELHPGFNVGISTGVTEHSDRWSDAYRHWSFIPTNHERDYTKAKK